MKTHRIHKIVTSLAPVAVLAVGSAWSMQAHAADYEVCVRAQVQNTDSEQIGPTGITEDTWLTAATQSFPARGVYVAIYNAGALQASGYTNSSTGCLSFTDTGGTYVSDIQVRSIARLGSNYMRAHNGGTATGTEFPGSLYTTTFANALLFAGGSRVVTIGSNSTWNAFMTGGYALWRVASGLSNKVVNMGFANAGSSSWYSSSTSWIEDDTHHIRINNSRRRRKFEVTHEVGHALARLHYGSNGGESPYSQTYDYTGSAPSSTGCDNQSGYSTRSAEFDSVGFKEGFANFYAARVFNNRASDANFTLFSRSHSMERFQPAAQGNPQGGHIRNRCFPGSAPPHGVSTNEDWMRFFWDVYTTPNASCGTPSVPFGEMFDIYADTRTQGPSDVDTWHIAMTSAINGLGSFTSCEKSAARSYLDWNAVGGTYHGY